ncbi:HAD-IIB family hydrolase [Candidatus Kaiserbacteria bacterium]|nr:HAD-IIB family hydrolase [Candidatus Kaiserbacteria bacterium]
MELPRAILFDVDDTLAESFKPPTPEMLGRLVRLLALRPLAILSAAGFPRIEQDFLGRIATAPHADRFYVLSNSTTECYAYREGHWTPLYKIAFTEEERAHIVRVMEGLAEETGVEFNPAHKPRIISQDSKVAYAALGIDASAEEKASWDPDISKRTTLHRALAAHLPEFEIIIGGRTTIDVLPKGMNKAYGVQWLSKELGIPPKEMLFIGDAFFDGGNDAVVIPTGIKTRAVSSPDETRAIIDDLFAKLA